MPPNFHVLAPWLPRGPSPFRVQARAFPSHHCLVIFRVIKQGGGWNSAKQTLTGNWVQRNGAKGRRTGWNAKSLRALRGKASLLSVDSQGGSGIENIGLMSAQRALQPLLEICFHEKNRVNIEPPSVGVYCCSLTSLLYFALFLAASLHLTHHDTHRIHSEYSPTPRAPKNALLPCVSLGVGEGSLWRFPG